jgi:O-antigen ligase
MEAAWLAAVCIIPLFFNIYSSRIFEPDKIAILRSLALLTIAAWSLKLIDEGYIEWKDTSAKISLFKYLWKYPLLAPVTGLGIVYMLATFFSVTPSISLFGSYQRLQGTYTTFSYLVIFASIISNMRTRNQVNRVITTVIFASFPVTIYALLQRYQLDPIPWGGNVSIRVAANMGNSIFVAAYLIMIFPLTIGKVVSSFREILSDDDAISSGARTARQITKATLYVFFAALQLIAIYMSGSRGPMLGLMAGIYLLFLLLSIYWKKRWMTLLIVGVALLGAVFLAAFNIKGGPLEALRKSPAIGRFGSLLDSEVTAPWYGNTFGKVRWTWWEFMIP